ncbi:MAG: penicillin-binding protein 2 [Acidobacteria bacterium]|nr:penicillin-binding protein 2 [Acidobacteriota bacterium]
MSINQDNRPLHARITFLKVTVCVIFVLFTVQLWRLNVLNHDYYAGLAEKNRLRIVPLIGPRGVIFDREGRPLVENIKSIDIVVYRDEISDVASLARFLEDGEIIPEIQFTARLQQYRRYPVFHPVVIKENVTLDDIAYIQSHQAEHPEIKILETPKRIYRYGSLAAHLLGYVGEVSDAQLKTAEYRGSKPGDIVGKFGVERFYNRSLTGVDGQLKVLVNSVGKVKAELEKVPSKIGQELNLTIDLDLQMAAEEQMSDKIGALVALDPRNGDVLAMVSKPDFDPNRFAVRIRADEWRELVENPDNPMQNRVIQNSFSPGSVFKIVMSLAGMEKGLVNPQSSVYCSGGETLYGHYFRCHEGGHGFVDLRRAIVQSCNVFFYRLGMNMGIDTISQYAQMAGLSIPTGIDLPNEVAGLVPSAEWKERVYHERWYAGETISVAIGQGAVSITPVQMARAVGGIALGGRFAVPRVVRPLGPQENPGLKAVEQSWNSEHIRFLRDSMWGVVNAGGTGRAAAVPGFDVCGKTGTAQTISDAGRQKIVASSRKDFESNAWFVGFAPKDDPQIAVAVLVQRGGYGGQAAAPVAGKIFRAYYQKIHTPKRPIPPSLISDAAMQ